MKWIEQSKDPATKGTDRVKSNTPKRFRNF